MPIHNSTKLSNIPKHRIRRRKLGIKRRREISEYEERRTQKEELIKAIESMPRDLQAKLCIYTWRKYWRQYVPLTAQIPSWRSHQLEVQQELYESRLLNIHFMHLSFNSLPENRTWIPGCQCESCHNNLNNPPRKYTKQNIMRNILIDPRYEYVPRHNSYNLRYYVDDLENEDLIERVINGPGIKENFDYDPLRGSCYENHTCFKLHNQIPILFSTNSEYESD